MKVSTWACALCETPSGRWIISSVLDSHLAWSGSTWVLHDEGIPASLVQICTFDTEGHARAYAAEHELEIIEE
jgi:hypothetical protein